jgi:hypothetical protein
MDAERAVVLDEKRREGIDPFTRRHRNKVKDAKQYVFSLVQVKSGKSIGATQESPA